MCDWSMDLTMCCRICLLRASVSLWYKQKFTLRYKYYNFDHHNMIKCFIRSFLSVVYGWCLSWCYSAHLILSAILWPAVEQFSWLGNARNALSYKCLLFFHSITSKVGSITKFIVDCCHIDGGYVLFRDLKCLEWTSEFTSWTIQLIWHS